MKNNIYKTFVAKYLCLVKEVKAGHCPFYRSGGQAQGKRH